MSQMIECCTWREDCRVVLELKAFENVTRVFLKLKFAQKPPSHSKGGAALHFFFSCPICVELICHIPFSIAP
jgi:hypothetical protein